MPKSWLRSMTAAKTSGDILRVEPKLSSTRIFIQSTPHVRIFLDHRERFILGRPP